MKSGLFSDLIYSEPQLSEKQTTEILISGELISNGVAYLDLTNVLMEDLQNFKIRKSSQRLEITRKF